MKTVLTSINAIKPYNKNPRNNEDAINEVAQSIKEFGFVQPIVVDKKNTIIIGHTRYLAAKELKLKKVPVIFAVDLSPKKVKALRIADNKVGEIATWNMDFLKGELDGLDNLFTGFGEAEVMNMFDDDGNSLDANEEWEGMPQFEQENAKAFKSIVVHFKDEAALKQFTKKLKCDVAEKTKYIWYPEIEIAHVANNRYK